MTICLCAVLECSVNAFGTCCSASRQRFAWLVLTCGAVLTRDMQICWKLVMLTCNVLLDCSATAERGIAITDGLPVH